jgi:hypothetical protein
MSSLPVPRSPITSTGLLKGAARDTCSNIARNDGASPIKATLSGRVAAALAKDVNN